MSSALAPSRSGSPVVLARLIAVLFLLTIVLGIVAQVGISDRLIAPHDAERTAANILAHASLYRTGFTLYLIEMAAQVTQTVLAFFLFKVVNRRVATLGLVFGLVGCTIKTFSRVFYVAPLVILEQGAFAAFSAEQLPAVALLLLQVNERGAGVALAFFGFETLLESWLILRSTFLPRWLGALTMVAGAGWLTWLSPTLGYVVFAVVAPVALVAALAKIGWFLVKGVDAARWHALAATEAVR